MKNEQCNCRLCQRSRLIQKVLDEDDIVAKDDLIKKLSDLLDNVEFDLDCLKIKIEEKC